VGTNNYFNTQHTGATLEKQLLEDLIVEVIKINGVDVYLIPRDASNTMDFVYGEDPLKKFTRNYCIEMYMNEPQGWSGAGNLFTKFGLELRDDTTFIVARRSFMRHIPEQFNRSGGGPREGDVIWVPLTNSLFEIKKIEEEKLFFAMGNRKPFYYELSCERMRYNNERFNTGLEKLDSDIVQHGYLVKFNLSSTGNGKYYKYETVYQSNTPLSLASIASANHTAMVEGYDNNKHTLNVAHIKGVFTPGVPVWGANSNASYVLVSYNDMLDERIDDIIDNKRLQDEANSVIEFDPSNPFGQP
jgi:hypothetical protein